MIIRDYRSSDLDRIKSLTIQGFDGVSIDQNIERLFGLIAGHDWQWRKARHIDDDVQAPGSAVLVAEDEDSGQVVGYITMRLDHESGVGWIPNMAVDAARRGQGIGRRLIQEALARFRRQGLELARIETLEQNPVGQYLYPACGFVEVARQIHYALRLDQNGD